MITSSAVNSSSLTSPWVVFKSTDTGASGGTEQQSAVTSMVLCNVGAPDLTDVTVRSVNVSIYLKRKLDTLSQKHLIVNELTIPAGETVFFSDERIILAGGDEIQIGATTGGTETTTAFVLGANYTILSVGDTDFTAIGAAANTAGVHFTATGAGGGTSGTATRNLISVTVSSLPV
jgi:hypothetical protein